MKANPLSEKKDGSDMYGFGVKSGESYEGWGFKG